MNRLDYVVDGLVAQLGEGRFVFQELVVVKGSGDLVAEAKDFFVPFKEKFLGVAGARHGLCGRGVGSKWGQLLIVDRRSSIVGVVGLFGSRGRRVAQRSEVKWV